MPKHGSYTTYNNYGCRCDPCRADANRYMRDYRATKNGRARTRRLNAESRSRRLQKARAFDLLAASEPIKAAALLREAK